MMCMQIRLCLALLLLGCTTLVSACLPKDEDPNQQVGEATINNQNGSFYGASLANAAVRVQNDVVSSTTWFTSADGEGFSAPKIIEVDGVPSDIKYTICPSTSGNTVTQFVWLDARDKSNKFNIKGIGSNTSPILTALRARVSDTQIGTYNATSDKIDLANGKPKDIPSGCRGGITTAIPANAPVLVFDIERPAKPSEDLSRSEFRTTLCDDKMVGTKVQQRVVTYRTDGTLNQGDWDDYNIGGCQKEVNITLEKTDSQTVGIDVEITGASALNLQKALNKITLGCLKKTVKKDDTPVTIDTCQGGTTEIGKVKAVSKGDTEVPPDTKIACTGVTTKNVAASTLGATGSSIATSIDWDGTAMITYDTKLKKWVGGSPVKCAGTSNMTLKCSQIPVGATGGLSSVAWLTKKVGSAVNYGPSGVSCKPENAWNGVAATVVGVGTVMAVTIAAAAFSAVTLGVGLVFGLIAGFMFGGSTTPNCFSGQQIVVTYSNPDYRGTKLLNPDGKITLAEKFEITGWKKAEDLTLGKSKSVAGLSIVKNECKWQGQGIPTCPTPETVTDSGSFTMNSSYATGKLPLTYDDEPELIVNENFANLPDDSKVRDYFMKAVKSVRKAYEDQKVALRKNDPDVIVKKAEMDYIIYKNGQAPDKRSRILYGFADDRYLKAWRDSDINPSRQYLNSKARKYRTTMCDGSLPKNNDYNFKSDLCNTRNYLTIDEQYETRALCEMPLETKTRATLSGAVQKYCEYMFDEFVYNDDAVKYYYRFREQAAPGTMIQTTLLQKSVAEVVFKSKIVNGKVVIDKDSGQAHCARHEITETEVPLRVIYHSWTTVNDSNGPSGVKVRSDVSSQTNSKSVCTGPLGACGLPWDGDLWKKTTYSRAYQFSTTAVLRKVIVREFKNDKWSNPKTVWYSPLYGTYSSSNLPTSSKPIVMNLTDKKGIDSVGDITSLECQANLNGTDCNRKVQTYIVDPENELKTY